MYILHFHLAFIKRNSFVFQITKIFKVYLKIDLTLNFIFFMIDFRACIQLFTTDRTQKIQAAIHVHRTTYFFELHSYHF